ncbi:hypothetical protein CHELA1G2_20866 [Hyphomicrobiales bacterium]|nr:hypothetical protein CHELA1G2_20866 [Hyphomicrobiales bacterium]
MAKAFALLASNYRSLDRTVVTAVRLQTGKVSVENLAALVPSKATLRSLHVKVQLSFSL